MTKLTVYGTGRVCLEEEDSFNNFSSMDSAFEYIWERKDWTDHKRKTLIREIKQINGVDNDDEL